MHRGEKYRLHLLTAMIYLMFANDPMQPPMVPIGLANESQTDVAD